VKAFIFSMLAIVVVGGGFLFAYFLKQQAKYEPYEKQIQAQITADYNNVVNATVAQEKFDKLINVLLNLAAKIGLKVATS
jgi:hypothetical protein